MESLEKKHAALDACIEDARRRTSDPYLLALVEHLVSRTRKAEEKSAKLEEEIACLKERLARDARDRFVSDSESLNGEGCPGDGQEKADGEAEPEPAPGGAAEGAAEQEAPRAGGGKAAGELESEASMLMSQARECLKLAGGPEAQENRKKGRRPLSNQLTLIEMISGLPEALQFCSGCGGPLVPFGERTAERIIFRPGSFVRVKEHVARYLCLRCSNIRPAGRHVRQLKARIAACGGSAEIIKFLKDLVVKFGSGDGVDEIRRILKELEAEPAGTGDAAESRGGAEAGCACGGHAEADGAEAG